MGTFHPSIPSCLLFDPPRNLAHIQQVSRSRHNLSRQECVGPWPRRHGAERRQHTADCPAYSRCHFAQVRLRAHFQEGQLEGTLAVRPQTRQLSLPDLHGCQTYLYNQPVHAASANELVLRLWLPVPFRLRFPAEIPSWRWLFTHWQSLSKVGTNTFSFINSNSFFIQFLKNKG